MKHLHFMVSDRVDPYYNIALEEYLLLHTEPEECILYLWQNQKTVVIGRNQNAWKECGIEELEKAGGHLARRLSGGGAVFQDLGNLNFTFLVRREGYDPERQNEVILQAVRSFGIPAVKNGRNDLTAEERKFSGNAYYQTGAFCYHHGTLLINADKREMSRYLHVSREKLRSKGVDSVKSRVVNLTEFVPELTTEQMKAALLEAFSSVYGRRAEPFPLTRISEGTVEVRSEYFGTWEWLYGRSCPFSFEVSGHFSWGEALIRLEIRDGMIHDMELWTDALDIDLPGRVRQALVGRRCRAEEIRQALNTLICETTVQAAMLHDLEQCLTKEENDGTSI